MRQIALHELAKRLVDAPVSSRLGNFYFFLNSDSSLPAIGLSLPEPESRSQLWNKAKLTLHYVYDHHLNDYDWFFKADDDT